MISAENFSLAGSAVAGPASFAGAASLLLWAYLHDGRDEPDPEAVLGPLAELGTTPVARAEPEERLHLPPRTLDDLQWMVGERNPGRVREMIEQHPELMAEFERVAEAHNDRLTELESNVDRLDNEMRTFARLYFKRTLELYFSYCRLSSVQSRSLMLRFHTLRRAPCSV